MVARTPDARKRGNADYGDDASLADLFRQIGYDERHHEAESEAHLTSARFA